MEVGKNYGWNIMEGNYCFKLKVGCDMEGLESVIVEYDYSVGKFIIGGFVYWGMQYLSLYGVYIYTDYFIGVVFVVWFEVDEEVEVIILVQESNIFVFSFGEDEIGELFIFDYFFFLFN